MIKQLSIRDIDQVVKIHRKELPGFLSELGEVFLNKFYKVSVDIPEMFTLVEKENGQICGLATGTTSTEGLYKKIISKDFLQFILLLLSYFITHPTKIIKIGKTLAYPGFSADNPELLTIAVKRSHQKKGIGRKLFSQIAREFKKRGVEKFKISVYDRLPANGFYKRMGCRFERSFEFLGEKMNYYKYETE